MKASLTLAQLLAGVPGPVEYRGCSPETEVDRVEVDSRRVTPGCAFLAVQGETVDGHDFVDAALEAGARLALVQAGRRPELSGAHVRLPDTRAAHPVIAANAFGRPADALRLAGVTGTNGKTTTAHLLGSILAHAGRMHLRLGTTGNWLVDHEEVAAFTTPFPLELQALFARARDAGATDGVMEVSSHALAQRRVEPVKFVSVGLTSFSQDHLDFHPDMEAYLQAKCLLTERHLAPEGVAIAALDAQPEAADRFLRSAAGSRARSWTASKQRGSGADIVALDPRFDATGMQAEIRTPVGSLELRSPLVGEYNLDNVMVAIGLAIGLDIDLATIARALQTATGAPGRLEVVAVQGVAGPAVLVDYAHTPDAVARALDAARPLTRGRLVVVLGCGGDRDPKKRPLMGRIAAAGSDRFYATSDNPRTEAPEAIVDQMVAGVEAEHRAKIVREVDRATAIASAIAQAQPDDLVLIAGKGHEDYQILGTQKIHFDDREHALEALRHRIS